MKLADYLAHTGTTAEQFAHEIQVSDVAVYRYMTGSRRPQWDVLARIAKATGGKVTANDFMGSSPARRGSSAA